MSLIRGERVVTNKGGKCSRIIMTLGRLNDSLQGVLPDPFSINSGVPPHETPGVSYYLADRLPLFAFGIWNKPRASG